MTETDLPPVPHRVRNGWLDLCGEWEFGYDENFGRTIVVPYPPESELSGIAEPGFHPVVWYRSRIELSRPPAGHCTVLHFGAVDYHATVWVNGQLVAEHTGGHTPFSTDITDALRDQPLQEILVRAEDQPTDVGQPRGKQAWRPEPHGIFYRRTTGIWQPVWIEQVPATHVTDLCWSSNQSSGSVTLDLRLSAEPVHGTELSIQIRHGETELVDQVVAVSAAESRIVLRLPALDHPQEARRLLWSPENPNLLDADLELRMPGSAPDRIGSYLGIRTTEMADGMFLLNGHPYFLRLVLEQGFWPQSHLAAPGAAALRREVELIKELGFNGARIHQKVEDPRFLYWCDRLGLLVWGEMANAFVFTPTAVERTVSEWLEVVRRDRTHPCIVTWVPLNESWGVPDIARSVQQQHYATALYHLTKALDPTRPVISNDGWEHTESDIWGVHDYTPYGDSIRDRYGTPEELHRTLRGSGPGRRKVLLGDPVRRGQPVVITEFGGLSYAPEAGEKWFGYSTASDADDLLRRFADLVGAIAESRELAGFCYTQLTDTLQEANGLLDEHRRPKLDVEKVREIVAQPAAAIPSESVDHYRRRARPERSRG
ncbi:glycoside hydrolase family 2 [Kribbella turkmenica]|uniref:Glycoside hydrolase family 2 n=1 Tax=Kribbella turkmenica TaxID=2530375 RepID=A0A4R4WCQ0_9ACTN|nr:glycoside hydrolase family 2 TIM barrel-domain containing protein [Kribbella turkmenica]TDD14977.1 glycoside hydrolase family 2 [Kribbella turkmenica]